MKPGLVRAFTFLSALLAVTALSSGCALFGRNEPGRMVSTLQSVQDDYNEAVLDTKATGQALQELAVTEVADLKQAYQVFSGRVDKIQATGRRLVTHADEMHFSGAPYLVESHQSPTACIYPRLRLPDDTKAAELGGQFDTLADVGWQIKRAFRAYEFDLTKIRDVLSTNLTPITVDAMSPVIRKAQADGDGLSDALKRALSSIEKAKTVTANAAPAASTAPAAPAGRAPKAVRPPPAPAPAPGLEVE